YLDWRSRPSGKNREEHLAMFIEDKKGHSEESQLKELELLYNMISNKKSQHYQMSKPSDMQLAEIGQFHLSRFMRGVTLLEWGNISVVNDLFIDLAWLFKTIET